MPNTLYYGDNLDVLRRYVKDETVDLVYLDPPFKSDQNYNVLFAEQDGSRSAAQIQAFEDTWRWDQAAAHAFAEVVEGGGKVSEVMQAFRLFLGDNDMLAYLAMMAPRLVELRRVLKSTGSLYLHCDPTASHYLKLLLDAIFGPENYRNEIIWKRSHPHGNVSRTYGAIHDVLLFYSKANKYTWNKPHRPYFLSNGELDPAMADDVLSQYTLIEEGTNRRFQATSLLNPNPDRPNLTYEFHGHIKVWRWTRERMLQAERDGRLYFPRGGDGIPREKRYLDEQEGIPIQDIWLDVPLLLARSAERLGYPTQKPEALLERIIRASSNEDDIVLDPFCGCGTSISAAAKLNRKWIGIDVTHLAISLIKHRLTTAFGDREKFKVIGEPTSLPDATALAESDPYQFQWWALGLVGARPVETKKGADKGIDGRIYFHDEGEGGRTKQVILSVKAGKVQVSHIRDLRGVVEREKAAMGVLISLEESTKPMRTEAAGAGFYESGWGAGTSTKHAKLQLLTIEELLGGKQIDAPPSRDFRTFKPARKVKQKADKKQKDFLD